MTTPAPNSQISTQPRQRWYQFSLRTLLVATGVLACGCVWLGREVKRAVDQRAAVAAIRSAGGIVFFEEFFAPFKGTRLKFDQATSLDAAVGVDLDGSPVSDAELVHLRGLTQVRWLYLNETQVTDAGMAHLSGLTQLGTLCLDRTQVTDAGLKHLHGLTKLELLSLNHTQVTDAGEAELKQALPNLIILR